MKFYHRNIFEKGGISAIMLCDFFNEERTTHNGQFI